MQENQQTPTPPPQELTLLTIADIKNISVQDNTIGIVFIESKGWSQAVFIKNSWRKFYDKKTKVNPIYIMVNISPLDALAINLKLKKQPDGSFLDQNNNNLIQSELGYSITSNIIIP
jgi:hypothetical protein